MTTHVKQRNIYFKLYLRLFLIEHILQIQTIVFFFDKNSNYSLQHIFCYLTNVTMYQVIISVAKTIFCYLVCVVIYYTIVRIIDNEFSLFSIFNDILGQICLSILINLKNLPIGSNSYVNTKNKTKMHAFCTTCSPTLQTLVIQVMCGMIPLECPNY